MELTWRESRQLVQPRTSPSKVHHGPRTVHGMSADRPPATRREQTGPRRPPTPTQRILLRTKCNFLSKHPTFSKRNKLNQIDMTMTTVGLAPESKTCNQLNAQ